MRLSSKRDSECFTNDKIASSRTMLKNGREGTNVRSVSSSQLPRER